MSLLPLLIHTCLSPPASPLRSDCPFPGRDLKAPCLYPSIPELFLRSCATGSFWFDQAHGHWVSPSPLA